MQGTHVRLLIQEEITGLRTTRPMHHDYRAYALKPGSRNCWSPCTLCFCTTAGEATGFPGGSDGKVSACNAGDPGSIPGSGRSSGEGNGSPLQYSCLENPMDRGTWWATVHGVAKSRIRLSDFTFTFRRSHHSEKPMQQLEGSPHSPQLDKSLHSILAQSQINK